MLPRHLPIWLTEFGIQSKPDPYYGVSFATQNAYRAISERIAWGNRRVVAFSQYLLRDDLPLKGVPRASRYAGFESGLRTAAGKDKPALAGFRLPVAAKRRGSRVSLWGLVRPATTRTRAVVRGQRPRPSLPPADDRAHERGDELDDADCLPGRTALPRRVDGAGRPDLPLAGRRRLSLASNFPRRHGGAP